MEETQCGAESHRPARLLLPNISRGRLRMKTRSRAETREGTWVKVPREGSFSARGRKAVATLKLQPITHLGRGGRQAGTCWPGCQPCNNWSLVSQNPRGKGGTGLDSGLVITARVKADMSLLEREVWAPRMRCKPTPRQTDSSSEMPKHLGGSSCRQSGN